MNCKKCNAELEEGVQICPECGMNQAEVAENAVPAEVKVEKKEPKMVPLKMVIAVAVVVALIAVFAVVIFGGLIGKQNVDPTEGTVPSQEVIPGATIPGTGLNDVSCKGSYTVSDEEAVAAKDTVIATVGNQKLTVGQLQAYYWLQTRSFLYSNSYYLSMLGLDYTRGLDEQMISAEVMASLGAEAENMTWQQFFLSQALDAWHTYAALWEPGHVAWYWDNKLMHSARYNGIDLPRDLYEAGEWTWDAFREAAMGLTYDSDNNGENDGRNCGKSEN